MIIGAVAEFWKTCLRFENGASPIQLAPSPPICVEPSVCAPGMNCTIQWQPMPA